MKRRRERRNLLHSGRILRYRAVAHPHFPLYCVAVSLDVNIMTDRKTRISQSPGRAATHFQTKSCSNQLSYLSGDVFMIRDWRQLSTLAVTEDGFDII